MRIPQVMLFCAVIVLGTLAGWFYAAGIHAGTGFFMACAILAIIEYDRT